MAPISIIHIVARSTNGVIGKEGMLPWHLPKDLKFFKEKTMGHCMVMGRKTFEGFPSPLKGRTHLVVSRSEAPADLPENVIFLQSLEQALDWAKEKDTLVYIIGGGEIFSQTVGIATDLLITEVDTVADGDVYYPTLNANEWELVQSDIQIADEKHKFNFAFNHYKRR
jgi:dihydrofolate reductase